MAFGDLNDSPSLNSAIKSSNAFSGIVMPFNGWQLEILHMPLTTSYSDIENLFTKYGTIEKIGIFYKTKDNSINCYLSYEQESNSDDALKENGKKVGVSSINVLKFINPEAKGNKRMRTDDDSNWGAKTDNGWGASTASSSDGWGSTQASSPAHGAAGRGGRGGGGAGRGGSRACFKCGEEGHMSRECPKGGGGGGGSRACFRCGEEGHMSRDCPKGGGRGCFNCGEEGHMSRDCSKPRRGRGGGGNFGNRGGNNSGGDSWASSGTAAATSTAGDWD